MTLLHSWFKTPQSSDFSIYNLPYGIFSTVDRAPRVGVAIGESIIDLVVLAEKKLINIEPTTVSQPTLNKFIQLGKKTTNTVRQSLQNLLTDINSELKNTPQAFIKQSEAILHMPIKIGDYTDFYSSIEHATNVGKMFRDPENALLPNWKHIPVGYHGRASSIILSGVDIHRPKGQVLPNGADHPIFSPSSKLDFELEMGFVIGTDTNLGEPISTTVAEDYIFGMVIFNDWSARDIQKWEYVPLGPFLSKNFASSMSPWVVVIEALEPFRVTGPTQDPKVLPYLQYEGKKNYDIHLEVGIQPKDNKEQIVSRSNFKYMYWNMAQQLAHHTVNGCNVSVGDIMASGTISGKEENTFGSMLELAWGGSKPIKMKNRLTRTFIEDFDIVSMYGYCKKDNIKVGFGEVKTKVLPTK